MPHIDAETSIALCAIATALTPRVAEPDGALAVRRVIVLVEPDVVAPLDGRRRAMATKTWRSGCAMQSPVLSKRFA